MTTWHSRTRTSKDPCQRPAPCWPRVRHSSTSSRGSCGLFRTSPSSHSEVTTSGGPPGPCHQQSTEGSLGELSIHGESGSSADTTGANRRGAVGWGFPEKARGAFPSSSCLVPAGQADWSSAGVPAREESSTHGCGTLAGLMFYGPEIKDDTECENSLQRPQATQNPRVDIKIILRWRHLTFNKCRKKPS